jgi:hypothetical protein
VRGGDIAAAVRNVKANAQVHPLHALTESGEPPATVFVNTSGLKFNTISSNTFRYYEELNSVVQNEPTDFVDPDTVGLFAAIGIKKGKPFAPDARMKAILTDAVAVANGFARANLFATRDEQAKTYPDRQWLTIFIGGSYQFLSGSERLLDAFNMFFYYATAITPAMSMAKVGSGPAYAATFRDSKGNYFDGGKTYKITLPAPIPAKEFWSFAVFDNQTRSLLETDQTLAGLDSHTPELKKIPKGRSRFGSVRRLLPDRNPTGYKRCPERGGTCCCGCTVRCSRGSTRAGKLVISSRSSRRTRRVSSAGYERCDKARHSDSMIPARDIGVMHSTLTGAFRP